jgi:hypothetical protein
MGESLPKWTNPEIAGSTEITFFDQAGWCRG